MAWARAAYVAASVGVTASLLAGCGGSSTGTKTPPPWTENSTQDGLVKGTLPKGSDRKVVDAGQPWSFTLAAADNPNVPTTQWPSADTVLTADQLKAAIPEATSVTLGTCVNGVNGPASTAKKASCPWSVGLKDSSGYGNSVTVTLVAIGADEKVSEPWTSERNKNFATRKSGERFFTSGSFGAKGSYYLDNDQSSVLISDGNMAAWIDLTFKGFNSLNDASNTLLTGIFPVLAKDLADHMPRKYA